MRVKRLAQEYTTMSQTIESIGVWGGGGLARSAVSLLCFVVFENVS